MPSATPAILTNRFPRVTSLEMANLSWRRQLIVVPIIHVLQRRADQIINRQVVECCQMDRDILAAELFDPTMVYDHDGYTMAAPCAVSVYDGAPMPAASAALR